MDIGGSEVFKHLQELYGVLIHRSNTGLLKYIGEGAFEYLPVFQYVRDPGWTAEIVLQYIEATVAVTNQIGSGDVAPNLLGWGEPLAFLTIGPAAEDKIFRDDPVS